MAASAAVAAQTKCTMCSLATAVKRPFPAQPNNRMFSDTGCELYLHFPAKCACILRVHVCSFGACSPALSTVPDRDAILKIIQESKRRQDAEREAEAVLRRVDAGESVSDAEIKTILERYNDGLTDALAGRLRSKLQRAGTAEAPTQTRGGLSVALFVGILVMSTYFGDSKDDEGEGGQSLLLVNLSQVALAREHFEGPRWLAECGLEPYVMCLFVNASCASSALTPATQRALLEYMRGREEGFQVSKLLEEFGGALLLFTLCACDACAARPRATRRPCTACARHCMRLAQHVACIVCPHMVYTLRIYHQALAAGSVASARSACHEC